MLVEFRTTSDAEITLFDSVAKRLLGLMRVGDDIPGTLDPDEVAAARRNLESVIGFQRALARGHAGMAHQSGRLHGSAAQLLRLFEQAEENNDGVAWSRSRAL